jgi:hypothetical protein
MPIRFWGVRNHRGAGAREGKSVRFGSVHIQVDPRLALLLIPKSQRVELGVTEGRVGRAHVSISIILRAKIGTFVPRGLQILHELLV